MTYTASLYPDTYLFLTRPDDRLLDEAKSPGFGNLDRLICFSHFRLLSILKNSSVVSPIVLEVSILVLIENAAVWRFCWALVGGKRSDDLYFSSGAGRLNAFGIGAFSLRHCPGVVPTIARKLRLKAGWSVNPTSNATVSKESFDCNKRDFAASTRLLSK